MTRCLIIGSACTAGNVAGEAEMNSTNVSLNSHFQIGHSHLASLLSNQSVSC